MKIWINGKFYSKANARVSVLDHGLLYGDGVFEGLRVYAGRIFRCEAHLDRLFESAKTIFLEMPLTKGQFTDVMIKSVRANKIRNGYIRLIVTRGVGKLGLDPFQCRDPQVIVIADVVELYPKRFYKKGLEIVTAATHRNYSEAVNPRLKSLNYLNSILAKIDAIKAGVPEALMLNVHGFVSECSGDNIFTVKGGVIFTPSLYSGILKGVTRDVVIELAEEEGYAVKQIVMMRHDIYNADECFLSGTAAEIIPAVKLDGRVIGDGKPGPITQKLLTRFRELVKFDGVDCTKRP
jgi:branched-chain amino acid aminotransferase